MVVTPKLETPAFTLEEGEVTRSASGSRTVFRFSAPSKRHLDGGFEAEAYLILFDAQGRFVHRRSVADRNRCIIANHASWSHEVDNDCVAAATSFVYEIQHRFDWRRRIVAGELPAIPPAADGSDYFRWLDLDPRTLDDRVLAFDFGLWMRNSSLDVTLAQRPKLATDSCRTEWELDLLDADRAVVFSRTGSVSLNYGQPSWDDASLSMDRRSMRLLKFFELRGRTEVRALAKLPVASIPA